MRRLVLVVGLEVRRLATQGQAPRRPSAKTITRPGNISERTVSESEPIVSESGEMVAETFSHINAAGLYAFIAGCVAVLLRFRQGNLAALEEPLLAV